jgi:hypothetical protein
MARKGQGNSPLRGGGGEGEETLCSLEPVTQEELLNEPDEGLVAEVEAEHVHVEGVVRKGDASARSCQLIGVQWREPQQFVNCMRQTRCPRFDFIGILWLRNVRETDCERGVMATAERRDDNARLPLPARLAACRSSWWAPCPGLAVLNFAGALWPWTLAWTGGASAMEVASV